MIDQLIMFAVLNEKMFTFLNVVIIFYWMVRDIPDKILITDNSLGREVEQSCSSSQSSLALACKPFSTCQHSPWPGVHSRPCSRLWQVGASCPLGAMAKIEIYSSLVFVRVVKVIMGLLQERSWESSPSNNGADKIDFFFTYFLL